MSLQQTFNIDTDYFTSNIGVGGSGGGSFFFGVSEGQGPSSGRMVRSLRAWYSDKAMRAFEVRLTDGSSESFGPKDHGGTATETFYLAEGEAISSLKMWSSNWDNGRIGRIEMSTDKKRTFVVPLPLDGDAYEPEIGSGLLVGVFGKNGADIDSLGFALLRRASAQLINVKYPDISTLLVKTAPRDIRSITYDNSKGGATQSFMFSGSETVEELEEWSVSAGIESTLSVEVDAGFPILAEAKITASVTTSVSGSYKRTNKKTTKQSFQFPISVDAGKRVQATATLYEGKINTKYTGLLVYSLDSGKTFQYDVSGMYSGISASQAVVTVNEN